VTHPSPAPLLELATAYQRSRALVALLELDVPTRLASGPRSAQQLAAELDAHPLAIGRLLDAAVALGLFTCEDRRFRNTPLADEYLVRDRANYVGDGLRCSERASRTRAWSELGAHIRAWRPGGGPHRPSTEAAPAGTEIEGAHRLALLTGHALAGAIDLSARRRLLDLGGGTGAMSIALCSRFTALEAVIVERGDVAAEAVARVRAAGLSERVEVCVADFMASPLPEGADIVLVANVLSMLDSGAVHRLFRRVFETLPAGGDLVITGWMLDDTASAPLLALLLCLEDIALDAPDVERSRAVYALWLGQAGFDGIRSGALEPPASWLAARKPDG